MSPVKNNKTEITVRSPDKLEKMEVKSTQITRGNPYEGV